LRVVSGGRIFGHYAAAPRKGPPHRVARRRGRPASVVGGLVNIRGLLTVAGVESFKLRAQAKARVLLAACVDTHGLLVVTDGCYTAPIVRR
jgi:hypothetical protein